MILRGCRSFFAFRLNSKDKERERAPNILGGEKDADSDLYVKQREALWRGMAILTDADQ